MAHLYETDLETGLLIKGLNFSRSGRELIVTDVENNFPTVISLQKHHIFQSLQAAYPKTELSSSSTTLSSRPAGVLTETHASMVEGTFTQVIHNTDSISFNYQSCEGGTVGVELLSLPRWKHLSTSNATVMSPQTREEKITVILGAATHPSYQFSESVREERAYSPLHVQKDQRDLSTGLRRKANIADLRSQHRVSHEAVGQASLNKDSKDEDTVVNYV